MNQQEIDNKLRMIQGLILDGDGVFFTGEEFRSVLSNDVLIMKSRHHHDGQGIMFLRALGIKILFATGGGEPLQSIVTKYNTMPSVQSGAWEPVEAITNLITQESKVDSIQGWLTTHNLDWSDCAYIGDDRSDFECMVKAGLAVTPKNGQRLVKKIAHITLTKDGGVGAIREFAEMVLDARSIDESTLPTS